MPTKKGNSDLSTSKRQLVRWNDPLERTDGVIDNLDRFLMLAIQSVCNNRGIKIPWDLVADTMGSPITEGAVVQHLAKLRQRMEDSGQLVPPPLRRGGAVPMTKATRGVGAGAGAKSGAMAPGTPGSASKGTKRKVQATTDDAGDDEEEYGKAAVVKTKPAGGSSKKRGKGTSFKKAIKLEDSDDYDDTPVHVSKGRAKPKKQKQISDDEDEDYKDNATWPAKPVITRDRKSSINYAELNGEGSISETEEGAAGESDYGKKDLGTGAANYFKSDEPSSDEFSTSRRKRSKVIVLPVCPPIHSSENSLEVQVVKDEDGDSEYQVDSPASTKVESAKGVIKGHEAHDDTSDTQAEQSYSLVPYGFNSTVPRNVEQVFDQGEQNQMRFGQQMSDMDYQHNQGYGMSGGSQVSYSNPLFPSPGSVQMGPPVAMNNAGRNHSSQGNGMRINTNIANSSFPMIGNTSYASTISTAPSTSQSSVAPSPNSGTAQSPLEMSFGQGSAYGNGYGGGEGDFDQSFLSSSIANPNNGSWMEEMEELFPGAGFCGGASGMGSFDDSFI